MDDVDLTTMGQVGADRHQRNPPSKPSTSGTDDQRKGLTEQAKDNPAADNTDWKLALGAFRPMYLLASYASYRGHHY